MRAVYLTCTQKISKTDADAAYLPISGKAVSASTADSATKATQDGQGRVISDTYLTSHQDISGKLNTSELTTALSELITEYGGTVPS